MVKRGAWLPMVLVGLLAGGCGVEEYNVSIRNTGTVPLTEARVTYGSFRSVGGHIRAGGGGAHLLPDHPIPEKATVEWRTEDGVLHRREVEVRKLVPKGFRGDIVFEIDDTNNVTVRVVPRSREQF